MRSHAWLRGQEGFEIRKCNVEEKECLAIAKAVKCGGQGFELFLLSFKTIQMYFAILRSLHIDKNKFVCSCGIPKFQKWKNQIEETKQIEVVPKAQSLVCRTMNPKPKAQKRNGLTFVKLSKTLPT